MSKPIAALAGIVVLACFWFVRPQRDPVSCDQCPTKAVKADESLARLPGTVLDEVIALVSDRFVDPVVRSELYEAALHGAVASLEDRYTSYMPHSAYEQLAEQCDATYVGIGAVIEPAADAIRVVEVLPQSPAERAGIRAGDRIIRVDGKVPEDWTSDEAANAIRGNPGTTVSLQILRPNGIDTVLRRVRRAHLHMSPLVGPEFVRPGIGYLGVTSFSQFVTDEIQEAVRDLLEAGARSLILDLRDNAGGLHREALATADLFLDSGAVIAEHRWRLPRAPSVDRAGRHQEWAGMPLIIKVNGGTASASEVVVGALQDHERALVVGSPTFGKGVAYEIFPLSNGGAVRITTGRWYTPGHRFVGWPGREGAQNQTPQSPSPDTGGRLGRGLGIEPDVLVAEHTLTRRQLCFMDVVSGHEQAYLAVLDGVTSDIMRDGEVAAEGAS